MTFQHDGVNYEVTEGAGKRVLSEINPGEYPKTRAEFTVDPDSGRIVDWRWCGAGVGEGMREILEQKMAGGGAPVTAPGATSSSAGGDE